MFEMDFSKEFVALPLSLGVSRTRIEMIMGADCSCTTFGLYNIWRGCNYSKPSNSRHDFGSDFFESNDEYTICSDYLGISPAYKTEERYCEESIVSSSSTIIAIIIDGKIDLDSLYDDLAYGFRVGNKTTFQHVERVGAYTHAVLNRTGGFNFYTNKASGIIRSKGSKEDLAETSRKVADCFEQSMDLSLRVALIAG
ncbi:MAG: hypothetical protein ACPGF7_06840 [Pontibacterium sp.]